MSRKVKRHTITAEGRDRGKTFVLTEMDADQGEDWAGRTLLALSRGGIEIPPGLFGDGWAGINAILPYLLVVGLRSLQGAQWAEIKPLMEEMMNCVQWAPPGNAPLQTLFPGVQIEEIATRIELRKEVVQLHLNFSLADALSKSDQPPLGQPSA